VKSGVFGQKSIMTFILDFQGPIKIEILKMMITKMEILMTLKIIKIAIKALHKPAQAKSKLGSAQLEKNYTSSSLMN
jgi:hypothetical protein